MDIEKEKLIDIASSQHLGIFKKKFVTISEQDKAKLLRRMKSLFFNEVGNTSFIVTKLTKEPFYNVFLRKILTTDYTKLAESLTNSLISFFDGIEELYFWISETISDYDPPAGPVDLEYC